MPHLTKMLMFIVALLSNFLLLRGDVANSLSAQGRRPKRSAGKFSKKYINSYLPKLVVFDPDMVFWPFVTETEAIPPFGIRSYHPTTPIPRRVKQKTIAKYGVRELVDHNGTILTLHSEALEVLSRFHKKDVKMAVASTTEAIATMRHILHLFDIDHVFKHLEIDLEPPIEHLNIIKNESSINYTDFIYFSANQTLLRTIKKRLNILTVKVSPERGITLLDAYSAIYLFNLRPCIAIKNGKLEILKELVSKEEIISQSSKKNEMIHKKENKIPNSRFKSKNNKYLTEKGAGLSVSNTTSYDNTSHFESSEEVTRNRFSNEDMISLFSKDRNYSGYSSKERDIKIGQRLAGSSDHYESKYSSHSEEISFNSDSQYGANDRISTANELNSKIKNDYSSSTHLDQSKSNLIMGIESFEQRKRKRAYKRVSDEQIIPTLAPLFHNQYTKRNLLGNNKTMPSKIRKKHKKSLLNYSVTAGELKKSSLKEESTVPTTKKHKRTLKNSQTNKNTCLTGTNITEYKEHLKPKRVTNRKGRGRTLLLKDDSTIICRRDRRVKRKRTISHLYLRNISTADILSSELDKFPGHLKAVHINAHSIVCHIDEVRGVFKLQSADVIGISESWLNQNISNGDVALPGYVLFRNDRTTKKGGGVALYVRNGIRTKVLFASNSSNEAKPELLFLEVKFYSVKVLVGVCYRQPKIGLMVELEYALLRLLPDYDNVLLMGDFNIDLLTDELNYDYNVLTKMLDYLKLALVPLAATHHAGESHTLIDLLAVSDLSKVVHYGQIPVVNISRHDLIFCVLSLKEGNCNH